jgi:hypothetical protein
LRGNGALKKVLKNFKNKLLEEKRSFIFAARKVGRGDSFEAGYDL